MLHNLIFKRRGNDANERVLTSVYVKSYEHDPNDTVNPCNHLYRIDGIYYDDKNFDKKYVAYSAVDPFEQGMKHYMCEYSEFVKEICKFDHGLQRYRFEEVDYDYVGPRLDQALMQKNQIKF